MVTATDQGIVGSSPFELVLSTWFVMYLHGDRPGGLPNDFLARGSSALLVFDTILCDKDALDAEERFKGTWLSSDVFLALKQEGILKSINFREYLPQEYLDHIRDRGWIQAALETMEVELAAINREEKKAKDLRLPPLLTWLNHYMFMGLEVPNSLLYEWQENHFKISSSLVTPLLPPTVLEADKEEKLRQEQQLISVLRALLPEFSLLPSVPPKSEAAAALRRNITKEKPALYRWIYGDPTMPRDNYHDLRLGPEFRILDAKIDEPRKSQTWQNFESLLKIRKATKDIRAGMQAIIADVVYNRRTIEDVEAELIEHQKELLTYLPSHHSTTVDVGLTGITLAICIAEAIAALSGNYPVVPPISTALATYTFWQAKAKRQKYCANRQLYPLAWFLREFKDIQAAERMKTKTHRRRR